MTSDDKKKQIGDLVLRLRGAEAELAHQREWQKSYHDVIELAYRGWSSLSVGHPDGTTPTLLNAGGVPMTLPTTAEVMDVILKIKELQATCEDLTERLKAFGV